MTGIAFLALLATVATLLSSNPHAGGDSHGSAADALLQLGGTGSVRQRSLIRSQEPADSAAALAFRRDVKKVGSALLKGLEDAQVPPPPVPNPKRFLHSSRHHACLG